MEISINSGIVSFAIFWLMFLVHIRTDFNQGIIASMKQRNWWEDHYPNDLYKNDYKIVLLIHSIEWSVSIMIIPATRYIILGGKSIIILSIILVLNVIVHLVVDDLKANKLAINLNMDQTIHFVQILVTWLVLVIIL